MGELVAVLGGGNGAHSAAADFARRGFEVRMFEDEKFAVICTLSSTQFNYQHFFL